jgi:hypothetical protein
MLGGNLDIQVEVLRRFDEYLRVRMSGDQAVEINTGLTVGFRERSGGIPLDSGGVE